ncbi:hypothetical protein POVWA2_081940 [Plasmodium ovale wallikeri]|uniref:Uncharacterized protein n=1 Tax=Plasmodium ovale wallikeri TaxID=864142 RepID=A0A1A9ANS1_PLAOA|nr:hypothetical protein POVWA1_052250 [Plasmodium ovale wallikeri]SBT57842.1 hypothetical protein POVWA2_081940 [Plasmodium ovale wallikeri]
MRHRRIGQEYKQRLHFFGKEKRCPRNRKPETGGWGGSKLTAWVISLGVETHIFKNARAYNSANRTS